MLSFNVSFFLWQCTSVLQYLLSGDVPQTFLCHESSRFELIPQSPLFLPCHLFLPSIFQFRDPAVIKNLNLFQLFAVQAHTKTAQVHTHTEKPKKHNKNLQTLTDSSMGLHSSEHRILHTHASLTCNKEHSTLPREGKGLRFNNFTISVRKDIVTKLIHNRLGNKHHKHNKHTRTPQAHTHTEKLQETPQESPHKSPTLADSFMGLHSSKHYWKSDSHTFS